MIICPDRDTMHLHAHMSLRCAHMSGGAEGEIRELV